MDSDRFFTVGVIAAGVLSALMMIWAIYSL
jgi:hypothetical protein